MKIFMTGGTGFIGTTLSEKLTGAGHQVTILTRMIKKDSSLPQGASYLEGDPREQGNWQDKVPEHEVIINLAGAPIFTRWTSSAKKAIGESRIQTTKNLVEALSAGQRKETLFISTSAIGYYGFHEDEELDEESSPGDNFLAILTQEWESAAIKAHDLGIRVVILRFGAVLGKRGGALKQMVPLFRRYMGSPLGSGKQWFSWIHEEDLASIYLFLLGRKDIAGAINCTAPDPVRNKTMTEVLGKVLGKPTFMPSVPGFIIRMIMGEFGSVLLKGQKVMPRKLINIGYRFQFPGIREALENLLL